MTRHGKPYLQQTPRGRGRSHDSKPYDSKHQDRKPHGAKQHASKQHGPKPPGFKAHGSKPQGSKPQGSKPQGSKAPGSRPHGFKSPSFKQAGFKPQGANPQAQRAAPRRHQSERGLWLYGLHTVRAALENSERELHRAVITTRVAEEIGRELLGRVRTEVVDIDTIGKLLPPGSVHQGAALLCEPLPARDIHEAIGEKTDKRRIVLVLDQISDPHNTGAILRSAVAFGVSAVIVQDRHAPPQTGVLAKSASGALDIVPYVEVVNIARALEQLGELGFWRIALAGDGETVLTEATTQGDIALVLGSEGSGVRRLVRERCDTTAFIPITNAMESLNVSNAAAIALYELRRN